MDPGENPEAAAKRELLEETAHVAKRWSDAGKLYANPARQTNSIHLFVAELIEFSGSKHWTNPKTSPGSFDTHERILESIELGEFSQALHVASLFRAQHFLRTCSDA